MSKYILAILKNETKCDHLSWVEACKKYSDIIDFDVIDLVEVNWLEMVTRKKYDFFLSRPPGLVAYYKQLYDERIFIINKVLGFNVYPSIEELYIYENKRMLSYFLEANNIPHPATKVFYSKLNAFEYIRKCTFPIVAKTSIGAGGSGVKILKNVKEADSYIKDSFSYRGVQRTYLPNIRKGDYLKRLKKRLSNLNESYDYFKEKRRAATIEPQKWFVIFQEYIQSEFEWRCVVVDDSYFGHKKLRNIGDQMSGTSRVSWDSPNEKLLNLLKQIVDQNNLWSQAIDLFYNQERGYLVNELQCFWGSKKSAPDD